MKTGINLLQKGKESQVTTQYQPLIRTGVIILLLGYLLIVMIIFTLYFILSARQKRSIEKISQKEKEIQAYERIETLQLSLKNRVEALSSIFAQEEGSIGMTESLKRVRNLTGDKIRIDSLEIAKFGNKVTLRATAKQVIDLIDFFNQLLALKGDQGGFDNISLSSLNKVVEGYQFSLILEIVS